MSARKGKESKERREVMSNTNNHRHTLSNTDEGDIVEFFKLDLLECIEEGIKSYKSQMDQLLKLKQPLKHSELMNFHLEKSKLLKDILDESYQDICKISDPTVVLKLNALVQLAKMRLEKLMDIQLNGRYIRMSETNDDELIKKVKEFTSQAEMLYDEQAEQFDIKGKTSDDLKIAHSKWEKEAVLLFDKLLQENQTETNDFWKNEIRSKIKERWDELYENFDESNLGCSKPLGNGKSKEISEKTQKNLCPFLNSEGNTTDFGMKRQSQIPKEKSEMPREHKNPIPAKALGIPNQLQPEVPIRQHRNAINKPTFSQHPIPTNINIGIYLDSNSFNVALYQLSSRRSLISSNPFVRLSSVTPEIYFADQRIVIGKQVQPFYGSDKSRCFNLYKLITSSASNDFCNFSIRNNKYTLCTHQIVAVFLKHILRNIETNYLVTIKRIIMTIPFAPTSAAKERIRESARIAGFVDIRILSTLLATAISTLDKSLYFKNVLRRSSVVVVEPMHLLVLDVQKYSFSAGIVVINSTSISVECSYGSKNTTNGTSSNFKSFHSKLYHNQEVDEISYRFVFQVYKEAIIHVTSSLKLNQLNCIVTNETEFPMIEDIVVNIFKGKVTAKNGSLVGDSLVGASLLASSTSNSERWSNVQYILPSYINIRDSSRTYLRLSTDLLRNEQNFLFMNSNRKLCDGVVFKKSFFVPFKVDSYVPISFDVFLDELKGHSHCVANACTYKFTCFRNDSLPIVGLGILNNFLGVNNKAFQVNITCCQNFDGIYSLTAECESEFFQHFEWQRKDKIRCGTKGYCGNIADYIKVISFYDQFGNSLLS